MVEKINTQKMDEEMSKKEEEVFKMGEEEMQEAKLFGFNPFWNSKEMQPDKPYKFRIVGDKIIIREIEDNFQGKPTIRMIITVEELESGALYDLTAYKDKNKDGNYSSLTLAMRKLYALTNGDIKDKMITLTKNIYKHARFGDTAGYRINIIEPGEN